MITYPKRARGFRCIQDIGRGNSKCTAPECPAWEFYVLHEDPLPDEEKLGYCGLSTVRQIKDHATVPGETVLEIKNGN